MAGNRYLTFIVLSCLFCCSACSNFQEESAFDLSGLDNNSSIICNFVNCVKGKCVGSSSFPLYQCQCDEGWQSPFGASWLSCVLPNCSLNLGCSNTSSAAAPPASTPTSADVCSLPVCGNGKCTHESNSNATYVCNCNPGYINLLNKTDGYCLPECAIGADCTNLNIPIGGSSQPPPPPPSPVVSSQNSNQGIKLASLSRLVITWAAVASVVLGF